MSLTEDARSLSRLFGDAVEQLGKLLSIEVQLAQSEMSNKIAQAGAGIAFLAVAAAMCIPVVTLLLIAGALWLTTHGISLPGALLIVAAFGAVVVLTFGIMGLNRLKPSKLKPKVTLGQLERDIAVAKELAR